MKINYIYDYLNSLIVNPHCELNYNKDYELLIAVMLSAQTTDKRVNQVTSILFSKYDSLEKLARADIDDIKNIIKPIGTYNKKAVNIIEIAKVLEPIGYVPKNRMLLESLSGVGRKTVNVCFAELYHEQVIAVDTHIERVAKRLYLAYENDDVYTVERKLTKKFKSYDLSRLHHLIILFGRYYCSARNPKCSNCKLKDMCRYYKKESKKSV